MSDRDTAELLAKALQDSPDDLPYTVKPFTPCDRQV